MLFSSSTTPTSRRDFLRGVFGRAVAEVPASVAGAASAMARDGSVSDVAEAAKAEELARSIAVPPDQRDLAEALVRCGRMRAVADGRYAELFAFGGAPGGPATAQWLERLRRGQPLDRTRPRDVMLVQAARAELRSA